MHPGLMAAEALARRQIGTIYTYRRRLGHSILLGLEFLVTPTSPTRSPLPPTIASGGVLALIVLIRTFLSYTLKLEITGRWPWQKPDEDGAADPQGTVAWQPGRDTIVLCPTSGSAYAGSRYDPRTLGDPVRREGRCRMHFYSCRFIFVLVSSAACFCVRPAGTGGVE
jgi:hypothetical protein